ncbi:hypothetical protein BEWA_000470 [Theileria equi strain WA]|uniref:Uncharacterized protein n=1 Tax=Theileria equi strain WA TaxID=1537102 RepID=L0AYH3_THEEQ|nr:hypothetical protein BEWA_000470 [Theileria equi strain WA]AFZ80642.1 hypothetical protein BEWA_000470 [Theileria equi strain WA]|eukprot:XP_004830308.1 hypothetical protein BEWA_000470 [Theileria equi strain WA]
MTPEYMVEKVIYDTSTLWELKDKGKACFFCEVYAKGNTEILKLYINDGHNFSSLYLEKKDDKWKCIKEADFYDKLAGISTDKLPTCAPAI